MSVRRGVVPVVVATWASLLASACIRSLPGTGSQQDATVGRDACGASREGSLPSICSSCEPACPSGQSCLAGECTCAAGLHACPSDAGAPLCIDTESDNAHCGSCTHVCAPGLTCSAGTCVCDAGLLLCTSDAGAPLCVDSESDTTHCGSCDHACLPGQICTLGTCECASGETLCLPDGGMPSCVFTMTDNQNCGACGNACALVCSQGVCASDCSAPETQCMTEGGNPYCANTGTDPSNCGTCGTVCPGGLCCNGSCQGSLSDPNDCGCMQLTCASQCVGGGLATAACTNGQCGTNPATSCPGHLTCEGTACLGSCVVGQNQCLDGYECFNPSKGGHVNVNGCNPGGTCVLPYGSPCTVGQCQCQHNCVSSTGTCGCQADWGECASGSDCVNGLCT